MNGSIFIIFYLILLNKNNIVFIRLHIKEYSIIGITTYANLPHCMRWQTRFRLLQLNYMNIPVNEPFKRKLKKEELIKRNSIFIVIVGLGCGHFHPLYYG